MKKLLFRMVLLLGILSAHRAVVATEVTNPAAVTGLLARVTNAADRFETALDDALSVNGKDVFVITSKNGKPCIKGSSLSALTTGINWYLNHYAHVNLAWNRLTADLSGADLPVPTAEERREASVDYRYYLNYCTFSYSMSTWTWERWQKEIDWMALHGINMPLQIIGMDVVWYNLLTQDLGYTSKEANDFVAGPCFQAWWGMNNLEGWGGPNPDWWYKRQETLCKQIIERERELGMEPVLPGYSGMVPSNIGTKGFSANSQGGWQGFTRPYILDPNSTDFAILSAKYYARLKEVMGESRYYSMDPFHEGANTTGIDVPSAYAKIAEAMTKAKADAQWVIQFWSWREAQYHVLDKVEKGKLIVLDLYSDAHTHFGAYKGHDAVYCILPNFGGRTGFFGRLSKVMTDFYTQKATYSNVKGVGATPEAIEQVPVLYDALFELPWRSEAPDPVAWVKDYATNRYGTANADAAQAWELLRNSSLACPTGLQGPMEAVICARPSLVVNNVSSWGGTSIFYDSQDIIRAANLLNGSGLSGNNYDYDVTDLNRQALTDYAYYLLKAIHAARQDGDTEAYARRRDQYLGLILDLDRLLNTYKDFMLGNWTQLARGIADEASGTTEADRQWLELDNARTLITTWGPRVAAESGGLRDYSYREWGGMLKDFYYPRWKTFFDNLDAGTRQPDWFDMEWAWAHNASLSYSNVPVGNTADVAAELFAKYFVCYTTTNGTPYYIYRGFDQDYSSIVSLKAYRGETAELTGFNLPADSEAKLCIDFNNDGAFAGEEIGTTTQTVPANAVTGPVRAALRLADGTEATFKVLLCDRITEPRTVRVSTADETQGTVAIEGTDALELTGTDDVVMKAIPAKGYDFLSWTNKEGKTVNTDNPFTYYGKEEAEFTANFIVNKWDAPEEDLGDLQTIVDYGQYVTSMKVEQNGNHVTEVLAASKCPSTLFHTTQIVTAAQGSSFRVNWQDKGTKGLAYCRLSAYIDLNGDGDFDDEGEFLAVIGNKNSSGGNTAVSEGKLAVLLPYDIPIGITHMRLRFDSSFIGGWDAQTDAKPAKDPTKRMVYDIPVNVIEHAPIACTVSVASANPELGVADANGQPETYTYGAGEDVVLRARPLAGYTVSHWTDSHGRMVPESWIDGDFLRFKAPESGTYTVHFKSDKMLTCGDWTFRYEGTDAAVLTAVEKGYGELDLTRPNSAGIPVTSIAPNVLRGNTALTRLVLPAGLVIEDNLMDISYKGVGQPDALLAPENVIPVDCPWTLSLTVNHNGATYNSWGSGLLATGTNALADRYDGGFQFYLNKAGYLVVKVGAGQKQSTTLMGNTFSVHTTYDGKGTLHVTLTPSDGAEETFTFEQKLNDITTFATAIPEGIVIERLKIANPWLGSTPFKGCTALTEFSVVEGNSHYTTANGLLYNATATRLLAYPEGRLTKFPFRLLTREDAVRTAQAEPNATADGSEVVIDNARGVKAVAAAVTSVPASLWALTPVTGGYNVEHVNSNRFFGTASAGGEVQLPVDPVNWRGTYTYNLAVIENSPVLELESSNGLYATARSDGRVTLEKAMAKWTLQETTSVPITLTTAGWASVCLPVAVVIPTAETATVYAVTTVSDGVLGTTQVAPGTVLAAGQGFLVTAPSTRTVDFTIAFTEPQIKLEDNLLRGATIRRTGFSVNAFYVLDEQDGKPVMRLSPDTAVPANTAYLLRTACPDEAADVLSFDVLTGVSEVKADKADAQVYYDLSGRKVTRPAKGVYIRQDGKKETFQ